MATTQTSDVPPASVQTSAVPGRLPFVLPDSTRVVWASQRARDVWAPRVEQIKAAWLQIERLAAVEDLRPSALQHVAPEVLSALSAELAPHGLVVVPLEQAGVSAGYAAGAVPISAGSAWEYRVAITRPELAFTWSQAWTQHDDETIGLLLGFPPCCRRFFQQTWIEDQLVDTTWPMAQQAILEVVAAERHGLERLATEDDRALGLERTELEVSGPTACNILLRWLGVRLVPHLPCSFRCQETASLGASLGALGRRHGLADVIDWLEELLEWPVEWSALHGYAEIRTPAVKVVTRTDATAGRLVVRRQGARYPAEGARGLTFPFQPNDGRALTETQAYRDAFVPIEQLRRPRPALWTDNGFNSFEAMRQAHDVVLAAARNDVARARVVDLGAGNGELLRRLRDELGAGKVVGVETDRSRAAGGRAGRILAGDLFDVDLWAGEYDVALLMPGRILEQSDSDRRRRLVETLHTRVGRLVVYAYGDWIGPSSLAGLCHAAGLLDVWQFDDATCSRNHRNGHAEAAVLRRRDA